MRIAAFQMAARAGDIAANLAMLAEAAAAAKRQDADLLVAPELATTGYGAGEAIRDLAEGPDGAQVAALRRISAQERLGLVAGFAERAGDRIYNSAAFVGPAGLLAVYRKCQLYGAYEKALFSPGDAPPRVVAFAAMRLGLLICYDVEFPEPVRRLAAAGADLVLVPTAQSTSWDAAFIAEKIVPVRAFENGVAIVYADHCGSDAHCTYAGRTAIVMPDGKDAARCGPAGAEVIFADFDPADYAETRAANPYLADRRMDLF